jgi:hypothetical protein
MGGWIEISIDDRWIQQADRQIGRQIVSWIKATLLMDRWIAME